MFKFNNPLKGLFSMFPSSKMLGGNPLHNNTAAPSTATPQNQLKSLGNTSREELAAWEGYDPNSEKTRMTQYANAFQQQEQQNQPGSQPTSQNSTSPEQATSPSETTPEASLWDKVKEWDQKYSKRMIDRGLIDDPSQQSDKSDLPWSVQDIPEEQWENYKMGILADPQNKDNEEALMKMAMRGKEGEDGYQLDQERWNKIQQYIDGTKSNPYYKSNIQKKKGWYF